MEGQNSHISSNHLATLFPNRSYQNNEIDPYYSGTQSQQQTNNNNTLPFNLNIQSKITSEHRRSNQNQVINDNCYKQHGTKVTMIYANTYTQSFSHKELQVLSRFLQVKGRIPWTKIQHILYQQCGYNHPLKVIRKQWTQLVKKNSPSKQNILQYINDMLQIGMSEFTKVSNQLSETPFVSANYARTFFKFTFIKIMRGVEDYISKYFFKNVERLSHESKKQIARNLVCVNYARLNSIRLTLLRYFLLHVYLNKLTNVIISKNDIMTAYSMMLVVNQQFITQQKQINCRGRLSFAWSIQELKQLYHYYSIYGAYFSQISRLFILKYGEKQKFIGHGIEIELVRLIRQAFFISIKDRKDYVFSYKLSSSQVPKLKLRKTHPKFHLVLRLIGCFFGQKHSKQQMNQVYDFIGQLLQQSYKKKKEISKKYIQNEPKKQKKIKIKSSKLKSKLKSKIKTKRKDLNNQNITYKQISQIQQQFNSNNQISSNDQSNRNDNQQNQNKRNEFENKQSFQEPSPQPQISQFEQQ